MGNKQILVWIIIVNVLILLAAIISGLQNSIGELLAFIGGEIFGFMVCSKIKDKKNGK